MVIRHKGWLAAAIGGGLLMLGPVFGVLGTVIGLIFAFDSVGKNVDPATKSQKLAEGISMAMHSTAIGLLLFPVGAIVTGVALYKLLRRVPDSSRASEAEQPESPSDR